MNIRQLLPILALCLMTACQKDFDELNDTRQRWVEFTFDPSDYFSDILIVTEQGFKLGASSMLELDCKLRIVGYCFDADSVLIAKNTVFGDMQHELTMKFKHLDGDTQYHCLFIVDIVQYYSEIDYFETWYQLVAHNLNSLYCISFDRNVSATNNALFDAFLDVTPSNQSLSVSLMPITFNGYCVFKNYEDSREIKVSALYYQSFYVHNISGKDHMLEDLVPHNENENAIVFPITASHADQSIGLQIKMVTDGLNTTITLDIPNPEHRPFVATMDCTHQITTIDLY